MWDIGEQIHDASKKLKISFEVLTQQEKEKIEEGVFKEYINNGRTFPLFEKLNDFVGIDVPESWTWINDFIQGDCCVLFFNPDDEKDFYKFLNGEDLVSVINEIFNVEFYVTNYNADYLLGYNHSQCLVASGRAAAWLEQYPRYKTRYGK
ncbi:hypothetical protein DNH61_03830 [Paenibacillus sambharensis]|uniref:Uncharacterized protein n=1 Tax=Paenibacillus sambharensis TaxID=1803190 RepID=A0A2W1LRU8_9BACL|nr:hypothetical protein [Paenibacillus sambharensis]PZD97214.1 hypothetical protein DNH61_03830 [Paenibacillus sambharensis]